MIQGGENESPTTLAATHVRLHALPFVVQFVAGAIDPVDVDIRGAQVQHAQRLALRRPRRFQQLGRRRPARGQGRAVASVHSLDKAQRRALLQRAAAQRLQHRRLRLLRQLLPDRQEGLQCRHLELAVCAGAVWEQPLLGSVQAELGSRRVRRLARSHVCAQPVDGQLATLVQEGKVSGEQHVQGVLRALEGDGPCGKRTGSDAFSSNESLLALPQQCRALEWWPAPV